MSNVSHTLIESASTMFVNVTNHIVLNFDRRLHYYIKFRYGKNGAEVEALISSCFRKDGEFPSEETELRGWLEVYLPSQLTIKANLSHFLSKTYEMLQYREFGTLEEPKLAGCHVFSLLSMSTSFVPAHIKISMSVLHETSVRIPRTRKINVFSVTSSDKNKSHPINKELRVMWDKLWNKGFHIRKFAYQITTNGYSASLLQQHSAKEKDMTVSLDNYVPDTVVGIDSGMRLLCIVIHVREVDVKKEKAKCKKRESKQNKMNESKKNSERSGRRKE